MKIRLLPVALAVVLFFAAAPSAQQPFDRLRTAPSNVEGQPAPAAQKRPTFKAGTQIVSVDVIVRDGSGNIVKGLTAADFEVTEDGKPQTIRSFTFEEISESPKAIETADLLASAEARLADDGKRPPPGAAAAPAAEPAAEEKMSSDALAG